MKTVSMDIELDDDLIGMAEAIAIVYVTPRGLECTFRYFPSVLEHAPTPGECVDVIRKALRDYDDRQERLRSAVDA